MEKVEGYSLNLKEVNKKIIADNFPEVITENGIDFEKLKVLLGENVDNSDERYQFTWNGKNDAIRLYQTPSLATLLPCKEKSVNWDTTENLYIEGDNLEVLKLLQKHYYGKIKMIYIDPPYNTGNDFVYKDDFKDSIKNYKEQTNQANRANAETSGRYHTDWLNMMYPRLQLAKKLLREDGIIYISIGDNELSNLTLICNEIFGENNLIGIISRVAKTASNKGTFFAPTLDYLLCYAKNINKAEPFKDKVDDKLYNKIETEGERKGEKYRDDVALFQSGLMGIRDNCRYYIECPDGTKVIPPDRKFWRWGKETLNEKKELLVFKETKTSPLLDENGNKANWNIYTKSYLAEREEKGNLPRNLIEGHLNRTATDLLKKIDINFDYSKPVSLIKYLLKISGIKNDDIVLDFFSGSATTAEAINMLNIEENSQIKFILVQLPEQIEKSEFKTICDLGQERIRRAGKKIKEETNADIDYGFKVFKLDTSNVKVWNPENLNNDNAIERLLDSVNPIVDNRTTEDLLYEIILKEGHSLTSPVETLEIDGKDIYSVGMGYMVVVLDEFTSSTLSKIGEINPNKVVFKDSIFKDENEKFNTIQELKKYGIEEDNIRSI